VRSDCHNRELVNEMVLGVNHEGGACLFDKSVIVKTLCVVPRSYSITNLESKKLSIPIGIRYTPSVL